MSLPLPPRPPTTLDASHRVEHVTELDESHQVDIDDEDPYFWEKPTLGNERYPPAKEPKSPFEIERFRILYPYPPAIHHTHPFDFLIFKRLSRNTLVVLFPLMTEGSLYDFKPPEVKSSSGMPEFLTMRECRETQWYYHYQPYLGFIPRENVFEGPIFGRFHGNRSYFETKVKAKGSSFIFDPDLAYSWILVEDALLALVCLFHVSLRPLNAPRNSTPSDTKFFEPKPSVKKVVDSVIFAQKLFLQLIGEVRYSMAVSSELDSRNWLAAMPKFPFAQHFDYDWLANLAASKAMTTKHLAGTVITPKSLLNGYQAHRFAFFDVAVYIPLAIIEYEERLPIVHSRPPIHTGRTKFKISITQEQMKELWLPFPLDTVKKRIELEWDLHYRSIFLNIPFVPRPPPVFSDHDHIPPPVSPPQSPLPEPPETTYDSPQSPLSNQEIPQPYPNSGQEPGRWWYEHHNQVKLIAELGDDDELPRERRRREGKERESEGSRSMANIPDNFKDTVYVWEPTDLHPTFLLRRRLSLEEVRVIWTSIPSTNKIYNSYDEEWDFYDACCDMETRTQRPIPDRDPTLSDVPLSIPSEKRVGNASGSKGDLMAVLRGRIEDAKTCRIAFFCEDDPRRAAIERFGFVLSSSISHQRLITSKDKVHWYFHLGYKDIMLSQDDVEQVERILFCLKEDHIDHLHHCLDIYTDPRSIIERNTVTVKHFPNAEFDFSPIRQRNLYILSFSGDHRQDWFVGLTQASDLVFALRQGWATSREELVESFLVYGIQFYTLAPVPPPSQIQYYPKAPRVPTASSNERRLFPDETFMMPVEPIDKHYTVTDFFEYERRREELLDKPHGRVAGRSGGIVARLWRRDTSKYQQRKRSVLVGPTDLALWKGIRVRCGGDEYYDDELRGTTDSYICGQYEARKVYERGVDDWHQMSWYSTNAAYNSRNKNLTSRWTQVDEMKFLQNEEELIEKLTPRSAKEWKGQARAYQGILEGWIEKHCRSFVDKYVNNKR